MTSNTTRNRAEVEVDANTVKGVADDLVFAMEEFAAALPPTFLEMGKVIDVFFSSLTQEELDHLSKL